MKENFDRCLKLILVSEGGFVNDPVDKGGATNLGITLTTLRQYYDRYGYGDFDGDGDVDIQDVRLLDTQTEASPIYHTFFWDRVRGDDLSSGIDYVVFDSSVNHGPTNAGRFLQRAINRMGKNLVVDGVIGPKTITASLQFDSAMLSEDILKEREIFYRKIVAKDQSQVKFFKGWMNRLSHIRSDLNQFV
jgi:lysozyme family protein